MSHGIVIVDDERVGRWATVEISDTEVIVEFDNPDDLDRFSNLAEEHGASLSFLQTPTLPEAICE